MPGIVGLITKKGREWAEPQLSRMVKTLRHESFYAAGLQINESLGLYVGWVARKASFSDGMPIRNERGDIELFFSGEEYCDPETISALERRGHSFSEGAAYLVHLYEDNAGFPGELNGRFHGLVIDHRGNVATLFNDRYGMHRIYYHEANETFYFAAEAKAILAVRPELRRLDMRGLGEFITCGCVLENRTLFENIYLMPPGSAWRFREATLEEKRVYFVPRQWEDQTPLDPDAYYSELRNVFSKVLPRYFQGRERIGMSVTGGLDTRMILAWHKPAPSSLPCYSFGGAYRESQDVILGRRVANACGQRHEVISVSENFLSRFAHYAERTVYLSDGCVGVRHAPDLFVNEAAREIAPVRMTGNYGGEVLRRVRAFKPAAPAAGPFNLELLSWLGKARDTYTQITQTHPLSFSVFQQAPWHHYGLLSLEQTQVSLRSPFLDNELVRAVFRAPDTAVTNEDVCLKLIGDGNQALRQIRTDRGLAGNAGGVSGAVSRMFLQFTFKAEYAYDYGMPQRVAQIDHMLGPLHVERLFLGRHKFYHFRVWYRDTLSKYLQEMLLDSRTLSRPYLQRHIVEAMVKGHLKGDCNHTEYIHKILTLEYLHRLFLSSN